MKDENLLNRLGRTATREGPRRRPTTTSSPAGGERCQIETRVARHPPPPPPPHRPPRPGTARHERGGQSGTRANTTAGTAARCPAPRACKGGHARSRCAVPASRAITLRPARRASTRKDLQGGGTSTHLHGGGCGLTVGHAECLHGQANTQAGKHVDHLGARERGLACGCEERTNQHATPHAEEAHLELNAAN